MICQYTDCLKRIKLIEQILGKCNKCTHYYCAKHRLLEAHGCAYDSKSKKEDIAKYIETHKCVNDKVVKI
jgi:predicted nucleic acid binding AN1-type Zn finger protein